MRLVTLAVWCLGVISIAAGCGATEAGNGDSSTKDPYLGTWKGEDPFGQTMVLTLKEKDRLTLNISSSRGSFSKRGSYTIDPSQTPSHFNITLSDRQIKTIAKLAYDRHFVFESINSADARPTKFGDRKIVLTRQ